MIPSFSVFHSFASRHLFLLVVSSSNDLINLYKLLCKKWRLAGATQQLKNRRSIRKRGQHFHSISSGRVFSVWDRQNPFSIKYSSSYHPKQQQRGFSGTLSLTLKKDIYWWTSCKLSFDRFNPDERRREISFCEFWMLPSSIPFSALLYGLSISTPNKGKVNNPFNFFALFRKAQNSS